MVQVMSEEGPLSHVLDHVYLELPAGVQIPLPTVQFFDSGFFQVTVLTRFMVMELIAATLVVLTILPLASHLKQNRVSRGPFFNLIEAILLFIRDRVARPIIGHDADKFLPLLWALFFFILYNNLLGLIPGGASATGSIAVTSMLALTTLGTVLMVGFREQGVVSFFTGMVPHFEMHPVVKAPLWLLMLVIEVMGLFIRHCVLAMRLFANMLAGHIVLAVILGFALAEGLGLFGSLGIGVVSIVGSIPMNLLEILVAFLQAFIFTLLSAVFIGSAYHAH